MVGGKRELMSRVEEIKKTAVFDKFSKRPLCCAEVHTLVSKFYGYVGHKAMYFSDPHNYDVVANLCRVVECFAMLTHGIDVPDQNEATAIRNIFNDVFKPMLNNIVAEANKLNGKSYDDKVLTMMEIMNGLNTPSIGKCDARNPLDGRVFQSFVSIYKLFYKLHKEWDDLCQRGFTVQVFYDYMGCFYYERKSGSEKSETDKLEELFSIMDGKMKFQQVYEKASVRFAIVPLGTTEGNVHTHETKGRYDYDGYRLEPKH